MNALNTALIIGIMVFLTAERRKEKKEQEKLSQKIMDFHNSAHVDEDGTMHYMYTS